MRKTYPLHVEGKNPDRLLDAAKHDIRKYLKRERAKQLPVDANFWEFDCKSGADQASAAEVPVGELIASVDALVKDGASSFYVEVLAKPGVRTVRDADASGNDAMDDFGDE